jgi:hypothetical protein
LPRLPVSGTQFTLEGADGSSELVVLEATGGELGAALLLLARTARLAAAAGEQPLRELTITDFEYLLLSLHASWRGPRMTLGLACSECHELAQLTLEVSELLSQAAPRQPADVTCHPTRAGWFLLAQDAFRLPRVADLLQVAHEPHPVRALTALTVADNALPRSRRMRIERAMSLMAPELSRTIAGSCPACGGRVRAPLSIARVVVAELRQDAAQLHDEVDLIARHYHWPQTEILALPLARRRAYVERIRRALAQAA